MTKDKGYYVRCKTESNYFFKNTKDWFALCGVPLSDKMVLAAIANKDAKIKMLNDGICEEIFFKWKKKKGKRKLDYFEVNKGIDYV